MDKFTEVDNENLVFKRFFKLSLDLLCIADIEGTFIKLNKSWEVVMGYKIEELEGQKFLKFVHPEDIDDTLKVMSDLSNQKQVVNFTNRYICKDGSYRYIEWRSQPYGENIYAVAQDITDKIETQRMIEKDRINMKAILDNIPFLVWLKNENGRFIKVNKEFEKACGKKIEEIINFTDYDVWSVGLAEKYTSDDLDVMKSRKQKFLEEMIKSDKENIWFETFKKPVFDESNKVIGTTGIARDISKRKIIEEELRLSEEKFRLLFQNMTTGFSLNEVILDDKGEAIDFRFLMVNKAYESQMNQKSEDVIGKTMLEMNPMADKDMIKRYCEVGLTGVPMHLEYFSKSFNRYFKVITYSPQKGVFGSVFEDVTKRKEMEEEIEAISRRLKLATKSANVGIWEYDIVKGTLVWDDAMYNLYGVLEEDFSGAYEAWEQGIHIEDLKRAREHINEAILGKRNFEPEFRVVWKDGSVHHIKANSVTLYDEKGTPIKMIGTNRDITEYVHYQEELVRAKERAEAANIAKSRFLANMSHEIRTPMNGIFGFLELLRSSNLSLEQKEFIREAKSASEVLLYLINDILDFSKIEAGKLDMEKINFNIRTAAHDAISLLMPKAAEKGLHLSVMIRASVPEEVIGDPSRIRQILNNLVSNAVKFTQKGEVSVTIDSIEEGEIASLRFEVKDTGIGISKEDIQNLFQPFNQADASTTRKYGGTGLGLAISKELVKMMNGNIWVESILGEGSVFKFNVSLKIAKRVLRQEFEFGNLNGMNILMVDDNKNSRKIVGSYLQGTGLNVFEATDAGNAITTVISSVNTKNKINVALIDYEMLGMSGYELATTLKSIPLVKDIKLILMTAIAQRGNANEAKQMGFSGYLSKPFKKEDLLNCIAIVLGFKKEEEEEHQVITKHTVKEVKNALKPRILLVEDNEMNRKIVIIMLKSRGMTCDVAVDGAEALKALSEKDYDVVFMDCQMPVMDGYESTAKIREMECDKKHTTIVAMTANAMEGDRIKCIKAGMDEYISKPINFEIMFSIIEANIKEKEKFGFIYDNMDNFIKSTGLTKDDTKELFTAYISYLPMLIEDINRAIEISDFSKIAGLAHKLKGSSGTLKINSIFEMAMDLEKLALNKEMKKCENLLMEIKKLFH